MVNKVQTVNRLLCCILCVVLYICCSFLQVILNPRPWTEHWERWNLKGIEPLVDIPQKRWDRAAHPQVVKPWLKHDLMHQYR